MQSNQWMVNQIRSRRRQVEREKVFRRANRIVNHDLTEEKQLNDFSSVANYLGVKFPDVNLSLIKLYMTSSEVLEKFGWKGIGGCYISKMKIIFVKSNINHEDQKKDKFHKLMNNLCKVSVDVEDVVIHEYIHAVSDLIGRSLSRYTHLEEEFVYTNCIDFYHQKGMNDKDIVNNNFLPFCIQDVYNSSKEMFKILSCTDIKIKNIRKMSNSQYRNFLNKNAKIIVPLIQNKAQEKAFKMIELYNKYGSKTHKTSNESLEDINRFSSLDLD